MCRQSRQEYEEVTYKCVQTVWTGDEEVTYKCVQTVWTGDEEVTYKCVSDSLERGMRK